MAMMTPANFVAHVGHEVALKFATDILELLEPKPEPKAKPKKAKPEGPEGKEGKKIEE